MRPSPASSRPHLYVSSLDTTHAGLLLGLRARGVGRRGPGDLAERAGDLRRPHDRGGGGPARRARPVSCSGSPCRSPLRRRVTSTAHVGERYGELTADGVAAMRLFARTEAIVLDPVYSAKAAAALIADVESGVLGTVRHRGVLAHRRDAGRVRLRRRDRTARRRPADPAGVTVRGRGRCAPPRAPRRARAACARERPRGAIRVAGAEHARAAGVLAGLAAGRGQLGVLPARRPARATPPTRSAGTPATAAGCRPRRRAPGGTRGGPPSSFPSRRRSGTARIRSRALLERAERDRGARSRTAPPRSPARRARGRRRRGPRP